MAVTSIPAASTEYMYSSMGGDHDLTNIAAQVALPTQGSSPDTWFPATITSVTNNGDGTWTTTFRILVGPSSGVTTLAKGTTYDWWDRLQDDPEVPARLAGQVKAT